MVDERRIPIELTQGYVAYVDPIDADLADFKWCVAIEEKTEYARRNISSNGREHTLLLHRVIMCRILNRPLFRREEVDHIDLNGLNNCRNNIRLASHAQNARNRRVRGNSQSAYKGVYRRGAVWHSGIGVNGEQIFLGTFDTEIDAAVAYNHAALKHHGEFARFNDIPNWQSVNPVARSINTKNTTGYVGVYFHKNRSVKPWSAMLFVQRERLHLGYFETREAAYEARCKASAELYGENARLA